MTVLHQTFTFSLTYLGRPTPAPTTPEEAVLDRVPNPHSDVPLAPWWMPRRTFRRVGMPGRRGRSWKEVAGES